MQVTEVAGQYKFSLLSPSHDASLAMIPASFGAPSVTAKKTSEPTTFGATKADATTRFVLGQYSSGL